ncbi:MAG: hypothetical protein D0530_11930 [Methylococcales bacterium]|nr:MAG: hypothetical protein D0530_11930 [Methylococcales bacterium]
MKRFVRKLIAVEIKLGFLYVPAAGIDLLPQDNAKISALVDGDERTLTYNADVKRIFGLVPWYKGHNAKIGDEVVVESDGCKYKLSFADKSKAPALVEAETLLDISGLSSQSKGDIVEDRIKELIILQGQGLLSVYRPVTDTQGVDLIVTKNGMFQPIFLQIKGRFNVQKSGFFLMDINTKTFSPHHSYFVIGAYFNAQKIEIDDNLLLIPSEDVAKAKLAGGKYRIINYLSPKSHGKWAPFLIKKTELASKLLEKFEEMSKYIK